MKENYFIEFKLYEIMGYFLGLLGFTFFCILCASSQDRDIEKLKKKTFLSGEYLMDASKDDEVLSKTVPGIGTAQARHTVEIDDEFEIHKIYIDLFGEKAGWNNIVMPVGKPLRVVMSAYKLPLANKSNKCFLEFHLFDGENFIDKRIVSKII